MADQQSEVVLHVDGAVASRSALAALPDAWRCADLSRFDRSQGKRHIAVAVIPVWRSPGFWTGQVANFLAIPLGVRYRSAELGHRHRSDRANPRSPGRHLVLPTNSLRLPRQAEAVLRVSEVFHLEDADDLPWCLESPVAIYQIASRH